MGAESTPETSCILNVPETMGNVQHDARKMVHCNIPPTLPKASQSHSSLVSFSIP